MGRASKGRTIETVTPVVILVRPQLGENIGMAARAMLNCGLSRMRLVSPRDGWPNPFARRAAAGADAVLEGAQVFETVGDAVADLQHVVATTARSRQITQRQLTARRAAEEMRGWIGSGDAVGVLFGPERAGLENDDLIHADTTLSVPLNPQFSSLNIAQAVLLVAYEWAMAGDTGPQERLAVNDTRKATKEELANLYVRLELALDQSGFLRHSKMRPSMIHNMRSLLQRASMTEQEVRTFHGIIKYLAKGQHSEE